MAVARPPHVARPRLEAKNRWTQSSLSLHTDGPRGRVSMRRQVLTIGVASFDRDALDVLDQHAVVAPI